MTSHVTVTSHDTYNIVEVFRKNNIIQYVQYILALRKTHSYLE